MAGTLTGIGTTFDLPNYHGELFALTPSDTPLLSALGGLTGGLMSDDVEAEWQTSDLRDPSQRTRTEGATAPTAEERIRGNVRNVAQIHQEKVSVSYTKQAATGQYRTPSSAPYRSGSGSDNPVTNELDWQIEQALKTVALDVNYSFINGIYSNPSTNATARKTRGLMNAITTNVVTKAATTLADASSATDTITSTAHGLSNGDKVIFTDTGDATNVVAGRTYYVVSTAANTFKVSLTSGGAALTLGTSSSNLDIIEPQTAALTVPDINSWIQGIWDNGGLTGGMPVFLVNSTQKIALTAAYAAAYDQANPLGRGNTIGGVAIDTVLTDFGEFGIMLDRHVPRDTILAVTMDQVAPFFLNIPGKGVFFEEELAKTGASDEVQIYGEIGLKYGNERSHGILRGLAV